MRPGDLGWKKHFLSRASAEQAARFRDYHLTKQGLSILTLRAGEALRGNPLTEQPVFVCADIWAERVRLARASLDQKRASVNPERYNRVVAARQRLKNSR